MPRRKIKHHHKKGHTKTRSLGKMKFSHLILIVLLLIFFALVGVLIYTGRPKTGVPGSISVNRPNPEIPAGLIKAPTPYLLLPPGKQIYSISSGAGNIPRGTQIIADPLDARKGEPQTVSLNVAYSKPIEAVDVTLIMDNMSKTYPMKLISGTGEKGAWSGTWTIEDDHEKNYAMKFIIKYNGKQSTIDFPIR